MQNPNGNLEQHKMLIESEVMSVAVDRQLSVTDLFAQ
jgi:hypothetical protein